MELSSGECVVPLPVSDSSQNGAGSENQNTEGVVESTIEIEPEMYDYSIFLESDIADDAFLEFKEMSESASLSSSAHVVPEVAEELEVEKNMEQPVQTPPTPPQQPEIVSSARPSPRLKWTKELHASFVDAITQLNGAFNATPKNIRDIMKVEGLSLYQVKSHLQKYRLCKNPCQNWKTLYRRGAPFSRALGGPSKPVASSQPLQVKNQRRRIAKPNQQEKGSLYLKIEAQKHLQQLLEAQRVYSKIRAEGMASHQNTGKYPFTVNQNLGWHVLAANQNMGGFSFAANQNIGRNIFSENNFIDEATMSPAATFNPYQLNLYNAYTSAAAINASIIIADKPYQLQGIREAHPHPLFQASFPIAAASGSYVQGFNSASGESSGTAGMSDEEFVESFLIDYEEITGDSQKIQ